MTYLSHTVRSLQRDPIPGESVRLVLTVADDASTESVWEGVESSGGEVVRELQFGRLLAEVEQTQLDAICTLDGVTTVETDAVIDHPS